MRQIFIRQELLSVVLLCSTGALGKLNYESSFFIMGVKGKIRVVVRDVGLVNGHGL